MGLATRGHAVTVIAPDYSSAEGFFRPGVTRTQLPDMYDEGVRVLWARMVNRQTLGDHTKRNSTRFSRQLASLSRGLDFEIVMSLPHLMPNVVAASNLAVKRNKPLVLAPLLHEDDPNWPTRQLQVHLSKASAVIALTHVEATRLRDGYGVPSERVFVSGVGVDLPPLTTRDDAGPLVVVFGRLAGSKGIRPAIETMNTVWESHPETNLVIAGAEVPGEDADSLIQMSQRPGRTRLVKNVDETTKQRLLANATCLLHLSTRESFGIVPLEAMAAATPVVARDTAINREVIGDTGGILVEADASAAIIRLIEEPELRSALGALARSRVSENNTWDRCAEVFEAAYELALTRPRAIADRKR